MTRRLLDLVLRLFPAGFRARWEREVRETLEARLAAEPDRPRRARLLRRALVDALLTLPRAWGDALGRRGAAHGAGALLRDAAFAARYRLRHPLQSAVLVVTLAFALGSATAIGSVTHAILLRALPYDAPERVATVTHGGAAFGADGIRIDPDLASAPEVEATAFYLADGAAALTLREGEPARRIAVAQVSEDFFRVLGVSLAIGGGALQPGSGDVPDRVVLSWGLWQGAFGADPDVVGRTVRLNDRALAVVGVAPPEVSFPDATEAWLPTPGWYELYGSAIGPTVLARLRPDASLAALRERQQAQVDADWAEAGRGEDVPVVQLIPIRDQLTRGLRTPLLLLVGCAVAILLLACLNLAGIELAGLGARGRELRVRAALGASRARILSQLLTEALVLAVAGGVVGMLVAWAGVRALVSMLPGETPGLAAAGLDAGTLGLAALMTGASGLAIGALPALRARGRPESTGASRAATAGLEGRRLQAGLVVGQVALAVVLASGAGLLGRTITRLHAVPLGYDTERVLTFQVRIPQPRYEEREAWFEAVRARIAALPGVTHVGASTRLPLSTGMGVGRRLRNPDAPDETGFVLTWIETTDGWFGAMGIRRLAGGDLPPPFTGGEGIVLSRSAADSLFRGEPAVGRELVAPGWGDREDEHLTVLGVVDDLRLGAPEVPSRGIVFAPFYGSSNFGFAVRSANVAGDLAPAVQAILTEVDPSLAPYGFRTTGEAVAQRLSARTAVARLSGLFGGVALLLTALGLWGLVSRTVEARRRELGIRLALGASPRGLLARTVRAALVLGAVGAAIGVVAFLPLATTFEGLLFGVGPRDPAVLGPIVLLVLVVTALAAWLPARATLRMDAREALSSDG